MRAEEALRKPGDAARRESDGAVAVLCEYRGELRVTESMPLSSPACWRKIECLDGEDWQPLVTAERVEELEREVERLRIDKGKTLSQNAVLENRVTSLRSKREYLKRNLDAARDQIATLTAELEKARSGEAWVGEARKALLLARRELDFDENEPVFVAHSTPGGKEELEPRTVSRALQCVSSALDSCPTTAPLPPAEPTPCENHSPEFPYPCPSCGKVEAPTPTPAKPEWLAKGVRAIVVGGEVGWAFKTPCSVVHVSDQGELLPCFVSGEVAVIPHPDNDPELAAAINREG